MFAVIMAGGSGTRFWPASRESLPKQFLPITSAKSMLAETIERIAPLVKAPDTYLVINQNHAQIPQMQEITNNYAVETLAEPLGRNTAACIGLAAIHIRQRDPQQPLAVLPADHYIAQPQEFIEILQAASEIAQTGAIVTLGIQPTRPETGYGYIEVGETQGQTLGRPYAKVVRFVEKPNLETARNYLIDGHYLWNSGIFIFTAQTILQELAQCLPRLYEGLCEIEQHIGQPDYQETLTRVYPQLESISIDYGVLERTSAPIQVFPSSFGWSDVGSWQALYELRSDEYDTQGNLHIGQACPLQADNNLVFSQTGRQVALLGVSNLVVVDTADILLIADRSQSQEVKQFPALFKTQGKKELC